MAPSSRGSFFLKLTDDALPNLILQVTAARVVNLCWVLRELPWRRAAAKRVRCARCSPEEVAFSGTEGRFQGVYDGEDVRRFHWGVLMVRCLLVVLGFGAAQEGGGEAFWKNPMYPSH